jgi:hypothetical protein
MGDEANSTPRSVLACKTLVAEGMEITELSEELKWVLTDVLKSSQPRHPQPDMDDPATPEPRIPRITMARRHDSLIPLSHQHQHALAVIIRRRFGIEKGEPAWREEMVRRIREAYRAELVGHFEVEEKVLFPTMERHLGPLALLAELLRDHASLRGLVRLLESSPTFPLLDGFSALLVAHIRKKEERQLFAEFEKRMPADEARKLGKKIKARLAEACPKP